jgi:Anti-sigma-K factor rskA
MSEPGSQDQPDDDLVDLAIKQVTEGLSPAEQRALDALDSALAARHLRDFERAAAAASLAGLTRVQSMPPALRERLEQQGRTHVATGGGAAPNVVELSAPRRVPRRAAAGWFAAAACLLLAIFAWFHSPQRTVAPVPTVRVEVPPATVAPAQVPREPPSAAEQRAKLLAKVESLKVTLGATKDPAASGVRGDVVWDPTTQTGFMRFVGLSPNDPQVHQYQIWIFDAERDQRYPVDGGVFDVPASAGEVVIPIHAALLVHKAAAFAVTVEKPGGVVVSARGHVVALGAAS